jgi:glycosyltransferase involved in cell wall biosynthesis
MSAMSALSIDAVDRFEDAAVRPMLLVNNLEIGGAEVAILNLAIGLQGLGCRPLVCAWRRGGALEERFRAAGIELDVPDTDDRGGWQRLGVPKLLGHTIRRRGVNVLHAHLSDSLAWAALLQGRAAVPCLVSHHTTDLIDTVGIGRPLYGWTRRRLLYACSRVVAHNIAVSDAVRARLVAEAHVPAARISVIENGLALPAAERVAASADRRRRCRAGAGLATGGGPTVVAVGRLTREKGFDTLLHAVPAIRAVRPDARVVILGDGPYRDDLLRLRAELGLTDIVALPGFVDDVGAVLEQADVLAAPSHIEGLPMAVIEAMAWGLPVVVSDIPGHRDLVPDGSTGLCVPLGDAAALAAGVLATLAGGAAVETRVGRALANVRQTYIAEAMARRHLDLYRDAILRRRSGVASAG